MNKETQESLRIIAERIWDGHASVLVGAGFSKNAQLVSGGTMPVNWDELGELFFEKTRKHKPETKELAYANVLRLAEDVEYSYDREELVGLIRKAINDDKLEPSDIHMRLLALPWKDVYTTNYDTLLERAASRLKEQGRRVYSLIRNDASFGLESPPFLIKLHGDIKESGTIIITEEDYRTYSSGHQAMINYIRNSIMMDTMVLVGFSGNDPNFLQWLGWVKDVLKDNQRKVFLLSVDEVSDATWVTFKKKNVIVVDLKGYAGKDATHYENVSQAIGFLESFIQQREQERAQYRKRALVWRRSSHRGESIEQLYESLKKERDTYPGWLVMPRENREYRASLDGFSLPIDKLDQLSDVDQLLFLDVFNWHIEKSLYPIENSWEETFLAVLNRFRPFVDRSQTEIRNSWVNLKLSLLRMYRQEGWTEKWLSLRDELEPLRAELQEDQCCRFCYEQALWAVYQNDYALLEAVLDKWEDCPSDPYWDIRRGALWAEYLYLEKGKTITQLAFKAISDKLDSSKDEAERFYWATRKVHAHTVWNSMVRANFSDDVGESTDARQTWAELKPYDDIWYEREFFDSHIHSIEDALRITYKVASFQLGHSRTTTYINGNSRDYRIAYAYFLYYEETGFPIHLPFLFSVEKSTLERALSIMEYCSPSIADSWLISAGDSKSVSAVYNRRFLERTKTKDVDRLYNRYLKCLDNLLKTEALGKEPSWVLVYRNVLPEILSRLCMKASYESRIRTLSYLESLFRDKKTIYYEGLDRLVSFLVLSFSNSEIKDLIPRFAAMPVAIDRFGNCGLEPLFYVREPVDLSTGEFSTLADDLLSRIGVGDENEDKALFYRLVFLNKCNVLTEIQKGKLAEKLWANIDQTGFPQRTIFRRFAFLAFPHPSSINPQGLLKEYIRESSIPVIGAGGSITFYGGSIPIFNEIKGTTNNDIDFVWDSDLLNTVCAKIVKMWDSDKHHLLKKGDKSSGFSVQNELRSRFADVDTIAVQIFSYHLDVISEENIRDLKRMAAEFENYGMPSLRMRMALSANKDGKEDWANEIRQRLGSPDERVIADCVRTIYYLDHKGTDVKEWIKMISEYFRGNVEQGRIEMISALRFFSQRDRNWDFGDVRSNLLIGLKRLFSSTMIVEADSELDANKKMDLRRIVAPIVCRLLSDSPAPVDEVLLEWKSYYESEETCWDIRNSFRDEVLAVGV